MRTMTGPKRLIEVDEQTAIALEAKAAERGLSVPYRRRMASIATSHEVLSTDDIVELDRRWAAIEAEPTLSARQCRAVASHLGIASVQIVA